MQVLIDTNFLVVCAKQKIDLFEELKLMGFEVLISEQVINELKKIANSKQKLHSRQAAELALKILRKNKFKKISISGKYVDKAIINYADKNPSTAIATIDKELKGKIKNKKIIIRNKKRLEVI
ncbi:MAG: PIN domain-containing protein [archaeon]